MTELLNKDLFANQKDSLSSEKLEEIQEAVDNISEGSYMDEPGIRSVTIDSVALHQQKSPKDGWICLKITLKDVNGKTKDHFQIVPTTNDFEYPTASGKNKYFALKGIQQFGDCFGISFRGPGMYALVVEMFGSTEALVGKTGSIRLGHEGNTFCEDHNKGFCIMSNGKPVLDPETNDVLELPTKKDCESYGLNMLKKKVELFLSITEFLPSAAKAEKEPEILGM
tara:strand:+ start:7678 stop:8352 length:675 start_codon:yes stop_codon:yes gene_type:complete